jgi:PleD family two-component response regulator
VPDEGRLGSVARRLAATQRVLSIEDEHDIADFLRAYFRASGYDLVHLDPDTPLAVLHGIDEHRPDCVLLDLGLRGFSGAEAYRLLRTEDRYAFLPVIVVSARPDVESLVTTTGTLDAVVSKPFNVNTLADLVADRIAAAQKLREAGHDARSGLPTLEDVEARLATEIAMATEGRVPLTFALVRVRSLAEIARSTGDEGTAYVVRELVRQARELLPPEVVLGQPQADEVALILPDTDALAGRRVLADALHVIGSSTNLPGGAEVPLKLACGIASYPAHATDADELYMAADAALADAVERDERIAVSL